MKTEGQIKQKLKQVVYRHRKKFISSGMAKKPANCLYNRAVRLPVHTGNRATIRVCGLVQNGEHVCNVICDSTMAGDRQAEKCSFFENKDTAEELKKQFKAKIGLDGSAVSIGEIAREYPDIAALMWVLGSGSLSEEDPHKSEDEGILAFFGDSLEEGGDGE